jgi:N-acyl-D-aspartate/D-glutamate deacylase
VRTLPAWAQEGSVEQLAERLKDAAYRERVLEAMGEVDVDWEQLHIAIARRDRSLQGRSVAEIARERGKSPQETVVEILLSEPGIHFAMSEADLRAVMRFPHTCIASDSASRSADGPLARDHVHPRGFGTFPRVLGRYVREEKVLPWAEAIRKMTALPASRLGLRRRGVIAPGAYADLVVFDPHTVADCATYAEPNQYPVGIRHVFVNGVAVVRDGAETGARPGRVLRRGAE